MCVRHQNNGAARKQVYSHPDEPRMGDDLSESERTPMPAGTVTR
jgi:hypothetical protein